MDLSVITTFLSQYGTWGVLLAGVLTLTSDYWMPLVKKLPIPIFKGGDDSHQDIGDVEALHLLQARAKRSGCPQLQSVVRELEKCFFNKAQSNGPAKNLDVLDAAVNATLKKQSEMPQ